MPIPRIAPVDPPYDEDTGALLAKWMPPGAKVEPLKLFRTLIHSREIFDRMRPLGSGILGRSSAIDAADREIVIDRTCALCGCEYEWGVHIATFGAAVGITDEKLNATAMAEPDDAVWSEREAALIQLVDDLHDTAAISDTTWTKLQTYWTQAQIIELMVIVGFYHTISFLCNGLQIELEDWATRFPTL
jgi:alkylhydroperoxidase family enzyme